MIFAVFDPSPLTVCINCSFFTFIKIGLSRCVSTGVTWMDGRSRAAGTGKAASCGSGGGGGVAYKVRGYKQGWADGRAGKTGKRTAQIEPILARLFYVCHSAFPQCNGTGCLFLLLPWFGDALFHSLLDPVSRAGLRHLKLKCHCSLNVTVEYEFTKFSLNNFSMGSCHHAPTCASVSR